MKECCGSKVWFHRMIFDLNNFICAKRTPFADVLAMSGEYGERGTTRCP
jgi:hypothetical protein